MLSAGFKLTTPFPYLPSKSLVIAGISSILQGDNSMVIQSKLEAFIAPNKRETAPT